MIEAYPLYWPDGWNRTPHHERKLSRFTATFGRARDDLLHEIELLRGTFYRGTDPVLSTNIPLRKNGLPYANCREPEDPGVAVYFEYNNKQMCFACDKYLKVWENMVAIKKTIEAIRGIERWGASDMMEKAFQGFVALPPKDEDWRTVLKVSEEATLDNCVTNYRFLRSKYHPDKGGNQDDFNKLQKAWEQCCDHYAKQPRYKQSA